MRTPMPMVVVGEGEAGFPQVQARRVVNLGALPRRLRVLAGVVLVVDPHRGLAPEAMLAMAVPAARPETLGPKPLQEIPSTGVVAVPLAQHRSSLGEPVRLLGGAAMEARRLRLGLNLVAAVVALGELP